MAFDYGRWVDEQHEAVRARLDEIAKRSGYSSKWALYAEASEGARAGRLIVSDDDGMPGSEVVWFPAQGTAVMAVPRSHLRSLLWTACRRLPICPTA